MAANDHYKPKRVEIAEDMDVWKKAHALTIDIAKLTKDFPIAEWSGISQRTKNTAIDIPIAIESGFNKRQYREKLNEYQSAIDRLNQLRYLLRLSHDLKYSGSKKINNLLNSVEELSNMLHGLLKAIEKKSNPNNNPNQQHQRRPDQRQQKPQSEN